MPTNYIFNGCDTVELAKEFGTPLYVVSEDHIESQIQNLKVNFVQKYDNTKLFYASKAFLTKDMMRILMRHSVGLDVVSGGELYGAKLVDFPMENVMFHGNNKSIQEIEQGLACQVGHFVCDSIDEIHLIHKLAQAQNKTANILIRITPGIDSHTHQHMATAAADCKFGVPLSKVLEAVKDCMNFSSINLKGFHFHVGSQLMENTSHVMATEILLNLVEEAHQKLGFVTEELNLGGGFGITYEPGDQPQPASDYIDAMMEKIIGFCAEKSLHRPFIMIEPGRYIVGEAGITLYTVGSIKEIPEIRTYVGIDGGMPDNIRPALYQAKYHAVCANKADQPLEKEVSIAGKCCETGDVLIYDIKLPKLERGDILAVKSTGAYGYSMASNYNKVPVPAVVMIKDGKARLSVKRQPVESLFERDL